MPSLGRRVPQVLASAGDEYGGTSVSMPSLGRRVPQAINTPTTEENLTEFQCPLWADGSRRPGGFCSIGGKAQGFNALFGQTGPAGEVEGVSMPVVLRVSMPSLGRRVPQDGNGRPRLRPDPQVSMPSLGRRVPQELRC